MTSLPPRIRLLLAGIAAVCLTAITPTAHADTPGIPAWSDGYAHTGSAEISADRKNITLCDTTDDDIRVGVEYQVSFGPLHRTVLLQAGPKTDCADDHLLLGTITSATFCYGYDLKPRGGLRWCNTPKPVSPTR